MNSDHVFNVKNVTLEYKGRSGLWGRSLSVRALDDVTLTVRRGDILGIVGESGSGKTTLSKTMLGLLKPDAGQVELFGQPVSTLTRKEIAQHVQFIFQDPYSSLNPRRRVGDLIAQPMALRGMGTVPEREQKVRDLLEVVGLAPRMFDAFPTQMSGGQRQRVAIARALILQPEVLLCDEPTSALDVSVQAQVLNLLLKLREEFGLTYVIVSHNIAVIEHMTTHIAVMYLGRIVEFGPAEMVISAPQHPYTRLLLASSMSVDAAAGIPDLQITTDIRTQIKEHPTVIHD